MRFAALGSGSGGNAWLVESDGTRVLIDCGFGPREAIRRLGRLSISPEDVRALLVTHEHADHVGGAAACVRRFGWQLRLTAGTRAGARADPELAAAATISGQQPFAIDGLRVSPFTVPHDAREPVQFVIDDGKVRIAILTDAGHVTAHMVDMLNGCDAVVLECNHDLGMLARGKYPPALKRRIGGAWGHLDNEAAATLLARIDRGRLRHVVAAHLSAENNHPDLARNALANAMGCAPSWVAVADQDDGLSWRDV